MKNNDFEFIASKFEEENIKAPESMSAEKIINKFDKKNVSNIVKPKSNKRGFKAAVAAVACLAIFVSGIAVGNTYRQRVADENNMPEVFANTNIEGIVYFSSYDELEKTLKDIMPDKESGGFGYGIIRKEFSKSADAETADGAAAVNENATSATGSFGTTNTQVASVDEADKIKTDGKYIYYIAEDEILIYSADNGKTQLVTTIEEKGVDLFSEMFLTDGKLIVIGTYFKEKKNYETESYTFVKTYDLKDIKKPELINDYSQSGDYSTARLYDNTVYVISNYSQYYYKKNFIPCVYCDGEENNIPVKNICAIEDSKSSSYAVIGAVSIEGRSAKQDTKAILGVSENVYCNENNLYLTGADYSDYRENSQIIKYSFDKTKIELMASTTVKGSVNDQFSLDEKDGNLRIATTAYNYNDGRDKNYLFVLDEKLNKIGEVTGFARGEHIEAVRFIGNTAYVITFERTDPLFIIDLSDPRAPEITGEVKIDGFSSSLTPVDENTLLGIGFSTMENEYGGIQTNGLKFVLFDISDKNNPKVLSEKEIHDCDSPAQYDHKAICINRNKGYFAVPYNTYSDYIGYHTFVGIIRVNNGKIEFTELDCGKQDDVQRCTYIDDYLYAVLSESTEIESFKVK